MEASACYPGSAGEIVQGNVQGIDVLTSCPINLYTKVKVFENSNINNYYRNSKTYKFMFNILKRWGYESFGSTLKIYINSYIPIGKGFASSTADLCALYNALTKLFRRNFDEKELMDECLKIEPTDSIIFDKMTLFDYKNGAFNKTIGEYLEFHLLIFEGKTRINTVEFNRRKLPEHKDISDLIPHLIDGVRSKNLRKLAWCATESIIRNQHRLKYDFLEDILSIMDKVEGIGILGAHSGNFLGIILEDVEKFNYYKYKNYSCLKNYSTYLLRTIKGIDDFRYRTLF
ncbi:L-threonine kinase [Clostridium pasteurianum DSM 525 = ATCC 6013]|uniref:GHMP kinase n=1 Tax=Clostridium pasteurianum DSM 525 = ATCC 6013 TaxID=1262449 RepID=A0A0H3J640_CLOPA|nr:PduX-like protein [Clostridium pasteurianum]AJA47373.1 L-threonine kinase [Clostridium pasteurianum DSM 525 = ATCC 6013]AJA51361.1 L-threonine kinase [Clostridium pasteurianum DSM 525 = ATCC 6013]AOZ74704.1 kinase [Clostridium pasteurianum DSM 525 = ATCC 6013]AOZ78500.1 kinase [Clostridium pasteurianum]ELP58710.1 PduX-like protein [Clostridium pasteurianum DSM 525 = ATCC 6013]